MPVLIVLITCTIASHYSFAQLVYTEALREAVESIEEGNPEYGVVPEDSLDPDRDADSGDGANFILYCYEAGGICLCDESICEGHTSCQRLDPDLNRTLFLGRDLDDALFTVTDAVTMLTYTDAFGEIQDTFHGFLYPVDNFHEALVDLVSAESQQLVTPGCLIVFNDQADVGSWLRQKIVCWGLITEVTFDNDSRISDLRFITRDQGNGATGTPLFSRDGEGSIIGYPLSAFESAHGPEAPDNVKYWNSCRVYLVDVSDASSLPNKTTQVKEAIR